MKSALSVDVSTSRSEALARVADTFQRSGVVDPRREAGITLCAACRISPIALIVAPDEPVGSTVGKVEEFARRRAAGEPLSRILGSREFWSLPLRISPEVLDPRPETETIVESAIGLFRDRGKDKDALKILDLGVGSGALLCALLSEFANAWGVGVDISSTAAAVALDNIKGCGLSDRAEIRAGDWAEGLKGQFDLIVSNPPYIPSDELPRLSREVLDFDPRLALDGGSDGLDAYRQILPQCRPLLSADGWLLTEVGAGRAAEVLAIAEKCGFPERRIYADLSGCERVVAVQTQRPQI